MYTDDGIEIESTEAVLTQGFWTTAKSPRSYKVNIAKLQDMDALHQLLESQKAKPVGRLDQLLPLTHVSYSQAVAFCWEKTQGQGWKKDYQARLFIVCRLKLNGNTPVVQVLLECVGLVKETFIRRECKYRWDL